MSGVRRGRGTKAGRRALAAGLALAVAWPFAAWAAAALLVVREGPPRADALFVLSGSASYVERTHRAAELYRGGSASRVVLTDDGVRGGWSEARQTNPLFVERAREALVRGGVAEASVEVLPGVVTSTYDEAVAARAYAARENVRSLLFVTSAYHTRRTLWTLRRVFRGSGVEVGVEAADEGPGALTWWLSAHGWRAVALEYPKLVYYHWKYR